MLISHALASYFLTPSSYALSFALHSVSDAALMRSLMRNVSSNLDARSGLTIALTQEYVTAVSSLSVTITQVLSQPR